MASASNAGKTPKEFSKKENGKDIVKGIIKL